MAKTHRMDLHQIKQIRKGILLARHDYMVCRFKVRHAHIPEHLIEDWLEVYTSARKVLLGETPISHLTVVSYFRTLDNLTGAKTPIV